MQNVGTIPMFRMLNIGAHVFYDIFFPKCLIGWYTCSYQSRCFESAIKKLGWAVPHSDFLAWQSSATFIWPQNQRWPLNWRGPKKGRQPQKWRRHKKLRWPEKLR